jgi:EpsI family protein
VQRDLVRAAVLALVMCAAAGLALLITPRHFLADLEKREKLEQLVPKSFGEWKVDESIVPVQPSPDLQQVLDATYDEILARTYRNPQGARVMLSLAYGRNQHKGMNTHRPEVCYPAQGFKLVGASHPDTLPWDGRQLRVQRVVAAMGARNEPITYWLLVGDEITAFGYAQRYTAIRYGVEGIIPDGVLVRVSSIDRDNPAAFALQEDFIRDMLKALPAEKRIRLIGTR